MLCMMIYFICMFTGVCLRVYKYMRSCTLLIKWCLNNVKHVIFLELLYVAHFGVDTWVWDHVICHTLAWVALLVISVGWV